MIQKKTFQEYKIIKQLGQGKFSTVYLVLNPNERNPSLYALKIIKLSKLNEKKLENAINELKLLSSVDLPNVISYKNAIL